MLTAPIPATEKALKRSGLAIGDIGAVEVNEAFAPVPLAWLVETGADPATLNARGGAIALGHPLGGSGARLMTTLVHRMRLGRASGTACRPCARAAAWPTPPCWSCSEVVPRHLWTTAVDDGQTGPSAAESTSRLTRADCRVDLRVRHVDMTPERLPRSPSPP